MDVETPLVSPVANTEHYRLAGAEGDTQSTIHYEHHSQAPPGPPVVSSVRAVVLVEGVVARASGDAVALRLGRGDEVLVHMQDIRPCL